MTINLMLVSNVW